MLLIAILLIAFVSCSSDDLDPNPISFMGKTEWPSNSEDKPKATFVECPDSKHPHLVELGLPSGTKWACCNVGAQKPEDYGGYYAHGDVDENVTYNESTYKFFDNASYQNGKKDYDSCYKYIGSNIAGTQYDVVREKWDETLGGKCRMPSYEQCCELIDYCSYEWITLNGVDGGMFTGPSGATLFLPAAGRIQGTENGRLGTNGHYWSASLGDKSCDAFGLNFGSLFSNVYGNYRYIGQSVRPVTRPLPRRESK